MRIFGRGKKTERVEELKTFDGESAEVNDFRRKRKGNNAPDAAWGKKRGMTLEEAHEVWDKLVPRKGIGGPGIKVNVKDYRKNGLVGKLTNANGDKVDVGDAQEGVFEDDKLPKNVRYNPFLASGISPKVMEYFGTRLRRATRLRWWGSRITAMGTTTGATLLRLMKSRRSQRTTNTNSQRFSVATV